MLVLELTLLNPHTQHVQSQTPQLAKTNQTNCSHPQLGSSFRSQILGPSSSSQTCSLAIESNPGEKHGVTWRGTGRHGEVWDDLGRGGAHSPCWSNIAPGLQGHNALPRC